VYIITRVYSATLLRPTAKCFLGFIYGLGVCLFVRLSVTLLNLIKTMRASITKFSLWAASTTSAFSWWNFEALGNGVHPYTRV